MEAHIPRLRARRELDWLDKHPECFLSYDAYYSLKLDEYEGDEDRANLAANRYALSKMNGASDGHGSGGG